MKEKEVKKMTAGQPGTCGGCAGIGDRELVLQDKRICGGEGSVRPEGEGAESGISI